MSDKDDFIKVLQDADLITIHIGDKKIGLGGDMVELLCDALRRLPGDDAPVPHEVIELGLMARRQT